MEKESYVLCELPPSRTRFPAPCNQIRTPLGILAEFLRASHVCAAAGVVLALIPPLALPALAHIDVNKPIRGVHFVMDRCWKNCWRQRQLKIYGWPLKYSVEPIADNFAESGSWSQSLEYWISPVYTNITVASDCFFHVCDSRRNSKTIK